MPPLGIQEILDAATAVGLDAEYDWGTRDFYFKCSLKNTGTREILKIPYNFLKIDLRNALYNMDPNTETNSWFDKYSSTYKDLPSDEEVLEDMIVMKEQFEQLYERLLKR